MYSPHGPYEPIQDVGRRRDDILLDPEMSPLVSESDSTFGRGIGEAQECLLGCFEIRRITRFAVTSQQEGNPLSLR